MPRTTATFCLQDEDFFFMEMGRQTLPLMSQADGHSYAVTSKVYALRAVPLKM